jgi:hypothetical protein
MRWRKAKASSSGSGTSRHACRRSVGGGNAASSIPRPAKRAGVDFSSPRRLGTIFWSNMRAARAAGQWERAHATKDVLPYLVYGRTTSREPRKEHLSWVGTLLPIDDPWWKTHMPPNGWHCNCLVRQVGRVEAGRMGGVSPEPEVRTVPYRNRRTGEVVDIPEAIDPGWQTNPGYGRGRGLGRVLTDKLSRIHDTELRYRAIGRIVDSPEFERLVHRGLGDASLPAAELPPPARPPAAANGIVLLSSETAAKQRHRHPEANLAHYASLHDFAARAEHIADRNGIVHLVGPIDGQLWHAVVKATRTSQAIYLVSLHRTRVSDVARLRRRAARHPQDQ